MKTPDSAFHLRISPAELGWLAGAFGLTRLALPLPLPPPSEDELRQAQKSMNEGGLIRRNPGVGWQVERLAAFLVQWLGTAEQYTCLEIHSREQEPLLAGIYRRQELNLLIEFKQGQIECSFLPNEEALFADIERCVDLATVRAGEGEYSLPQPLPFIQMVWQDEGPAGRALERAGLPVQRVKSTLAWLETLKSIAQFQFICIDPQKHTGRGLYLCSHETGLWASDREPGQPKSGLIHFSPCSLQKARARLQETL